MVGLAGRAPTICGRVEQVLKKLVGEKRPRSENDLGRSECEMQLERRAFWVSSAEARVCGAEPRCSRRRPKRSPPSDHHVPDMHPDAEPQTDAPQEARSLASPRASWTATARFDRIHHARELRQARCRLPCWRCGLRCSRDEPVHDLAVSRERPQGAHLVKPS